MSISENIDQRTVPSEWNDTNVRWPYEAGFPSLNHPTHLIISSFLRASRSFGLYRRVFSYLGIRHLYLPHELPLVNGSPDIVGLLGLLAEAKRSKQIQSMVISDPYKQVVCAYLDERTERAKVIGAVNFVTIVNGKLVGDNLDGKAFVLGVQNELKIQFQRRSMVLFGCGAVSSAVAIELAHQVPKFALIDIEEGRALVLKEKLLRINRKLKIQTFARDRELDLRRYDIFYNGTGLGKDSSNEFSHLLTPLHLFDQIPRNGIAIDANYTPWETAFLRKFKALGYVTLNGFSHMVAFTSQHISAIAEKSVDYSLIRRLAEFAVPQDSSPASQ